ncbi:MAG: succinate dehydrogenase [Deltaproteobacteria bacterium]|nr:succinate dehydrogenase [Deltaproteobacteria bacterium]
MSESEVAAPSRGLPARDLKHLLLRRLHSLTGVLPIGAFLVEHFYQNFKAYGPGGEHRFDTVVEDLQGNPVVLYLEIFAIGLPILYHAIYGLFLAREARHNVGSYGYGRNWAFFAQRISGVLLVAYIGYHLWMTRLRPELAPELFESSGGLLTYGYMHDYLTSVHFGIPTWAIYFLGVSAAVFHFANGLWGFMIHWGITVGPKAQRVSGFACAGLGVLLWVVGIVSLYAFVSPSLADVALP